MRWLTLWLLLCSSFGGDPCSRRCLVGMDVDRRTNARDGSPGQAAHARIKFHAGTASNGVCGPWCNQWFPCNRFYVVAVCNYGDRRGWFSLDSARGKGGWVRPGKVGTLTGDGKMFNCGTKGMDRARFQSEDGSSVSARFYCDPCEK